MRVQYSVPCHASFCLLPVCVLRTFVVFCFMIVFYVLGFVLCCLLSAPPPPRRAATCINRPGRQEGCVDAMRNAAVVTGYVEMLRWQLLLLMFLLTIVIEMFCFSVFLLLQKRVSWRGGDLSQDSTFGCFFVFVFTGFPRCTYIRVCVAYNPPPPATPEVGCFMMEVSKCSSGCTGGRMFTWYSSKILRRRSKIFRLSANETTVVAVSVDGRQRHTLFGVH